MKISKYRIKSTFKLTLIHILLLVGVIIMVFPFYWMVISSFKTAGDILGMPPSWWPNPISFESYIDMSNRINLLRVYFNSIYICVIITIVTIYGSSLIGYILAKFTFRGRTILFIGIIATMMIPFEVRMLPLYSLVVNWGLMNTYTGLVFPSLLSTFGIFLLRQNALSIPNDLLDAGTIDGCSEWKKFFHIVHPLCWPVSSALAIFTFMWNWDNFLWPLLVVMDRDMHTLQLALSSLVGADNIRWGVVMAGAVSSSIILLIVFFIFKRNIIRGIAMSGIKG